MQKITGALASNQLYSGTIYTGESFGGAFYERAIGGTPYHLTGRNGGGGWYDVNFDSSRVTRTGTPNVTHGKQKGVKYIIKVL